MANMKMTIAAAAVLLLGAVVGAGCSKSYTPDDFPEEDVYVMGSGGFFVREGAQWWRYTGDGEKSPKPWSLFAEEDDWYLVKFGKQTVAIPKDRDPEGFLRCIDGDAGWSPYGQTYAGSVAEEGGSAGDRSEVMDRRRGGGARETGRLTATDYGLTRGHVEGTEDFYMMADNGDAIHVLMYRPANDYNNMALSQIQVNNLEGWVYASDQSSRQDRGDYWQFGGPAYVAMGVQQPRPYLFIAKDWSWVQVSGVDGVFNRFITKDKFDRESKALQESLRAQGITPRNPMAAILSNANRITDQHMQDLMDEIRAEADGLGAGHSKPSPGSGSRGREYVRVKEYSPNYTGEAERVYCPECDAWDAPHIHYNKVR